MNKPILRKIIGVFSAVMMVASMISLEVLDVFAVTPTYTVSSDYKKSQYYENLSALTLTGNARSDIVRVALTQLGYHEGNSTADFGGDNQKGSRNFVEYNRYHGKLDNNEGNGYSYGYYWCASFSTWCAVQAGIPESVVPTADYVGVSTQRLRNWFISKNRYHARGTYTPITGDYIFYKSAEASVPTNHVGLVLYVKGNTVYAIEGNAGGDDAVALKEYALSDTYIVGYGVPKYATGTTVTIDLTNKSNPGTYITTASSLSLRKGPGTSYDYITGLPLGSMVEVSEVSGNWGKVNYDGQSGWISLSYGIPLSNPSITIQYDANGGTGAPSTQGKTAGKPIVLSTQTPTRPGYKFKGWSTSSTATAALYAAGGTYTADQSVYFYAVWAKESYTIKFADHDGTLLQSGTYQYGDTVTPPADPKRAADQTYTYTFSGWSKPVTKAEASLTYTAKYEGKYIDYTVTFHDEDGTLLSQATHHYGDTVTAPPVPTKPADKTYSYTFVGWGEPVGKVTGNKSYTAVYDKTYLNYLITFADENGIILSQQMYHYGDTVEQPTPPTKPSDEKFDYTFLGWDKTVGAVDGMALYTAVYQKTDRQYTVTFKNGDGSILCEEDTTYGGTVALPVDPTMLTDAKYSYAFIGWSSDGEAVTTVLPVTADITYTALYDKTPIVYTVTFRDDAGNVYASGTYHYGDPVTPPTDPVRADSPQFTYRFTGWSESVSPTVVGNATYVAVFEAEEIEKPGFGQLFRPGSEEGFPVTALVIVITAAVGATAAMVVYMKKKKN